MAHVSKVPLPVATKSELTRQLAKVFLHHKTTGGMARLLHDLLGEEEQIMIIKRVAIVGMLSKECSTYEISKVLKVSTATVKKHHEKMLAGEYTHIEAFFEKKKASEDFWKTLEIVMRGGMPPRGRGRWSATNKRLKERS